MRSREVDLEKWEAAVRELAAEKPDAVYKGPGAGTCMYTEGVGGGEVGCLLGQAARKIGVPETLLRYWDKKEDPWGPSNAPWLMRVQAWQDAGEPWGAAVKMADHEAEPCDP